MKTQTTPTAPACWLVLAGCLLPLSSDASSVSVEAGSAQGSRGSTVEIPILVHRAERLGALQMELLYDPHVLVPGEVKAGSLPVEVTVGANVIAPGRWRIVMNTSPRESIQGDGRLMTASFEVAGEASRGSEIKIENLRAWDNTSAGALPYEMLVDVLPGRFTLATGLSWPLVATAIIAVGAGALLLVLVTKKRSRQSRLPSANPANVCPKCGSPAAVGTKFCGQCGSPIQTPAR